MARSGESLVSFSCVGLKFEATPDTSAALKAGSLDPDVAYMQGRLKVSGDMAAFWDLLPLAGSPVFREALGS